MRVVVDLQALPGSARPRGAIDHYAASLACAILRHAGNHDVQVVINHSSEEFLEKLQGKFPDLFRKGAFRVSRLPFWTRQKLTVVGIAQQPSLCGNTRFYNSSPMLFCALR